MAQLSLPIFAKASTVSVLEQALTDGALKDIDRICWVYIVDDGTLAYVDPSKNIYKIKGDNKVVVQKLDELPSTSNGDSDVLYIVNDVVYTFNGTEYRPSFYNIQIEVDALRTQVESIDTRLDIAESNIVSVQEILTNLGVTVNAVQAELSNKADIDDVYSKETINTLLATKADTEDVYGRSYIDNALASKADSDDVYSKQEVDNGLNLKADRSNTYTKEEIDGMVNVETATGETIPLSEYVNQSLAETIQNANDYTNQQMQISFI